MERVFELVIAPNGQPELLGLLDGLQSGVSELVSCAVARGWALSPAERARAVEQLAAVRRSADAAHLALVRSLTDAEVGELGASSVAALLSWRLRVGSRRRGGREGDRS